MPQFTLRHLDSRLWSRFTERANREEWPLHSLLVNLVAGYASGELSPTQGAPRELRRFHWLRAHYCKLVAAVNPEGLETDALWEALMLRVLRERSTMAWSELEAVPPDQRGAVLDWLARTSALPAAEGLTLRAIMHVWTGAGDGERRPFQFEVLGLPPGEQCLLAEFGGGWRVMHVVNGEATDWSRPFLSKENALANVAQALVTDR